MGTGVSPPRPRRPRPSTPAPETPGSWHLDFLTCGHQEVLPAACGGRSPASGREQLWGTGLGRQASGRRGGDLGSLRPAPLLSWGWGQPACASQSGGSCREASGCLPAGAASSVTSQLRSRCGAGSRGEPVGSPSLGWTLRAFAVTWEAGLTGGAGETGPGAVAPQTSGAWERPGWGAPPRSPRGSAPPFRGQSRLGWAPWHRACGQQEAAWGQKPSVPCQAGRSCPEGGGRGHSPPTWAAQNQPWLGPPPGPTLPSPS